MHTAAMCVYVNIRERVAREVGIKYTSNGKPQLSHNIKFNRLRSSYHIEAIMSNGKRVCETHSKADTGFSSQEYDANKVYISNIILLSPPSPQPPLTPLAFTHQI